MFQPNHTPFTFMNQSHPTNPQYNPIAASPGSVVPPSVQASRNRTSQQVQPTATGTSSSVPQADAKSKILSNANVGIQSQLGLLKRRPPPVPSALSEDESAPQPNAKRVSSQPQQPPNRPKTNRLQIPQPQTTTDQQEQKMKLAQLLDKFQTQNKSVMTPISEEVSYPFNAQNLQLFLESHPSPHELAQRLYQLTNSRMDSERNYFTKELEALKKRISTPLQQPSCNLSTHPEWIQFQQQNKNIIAQLNQLRTSTQVQFGNMTKLLREQQDRTDVCIQECSKVETKLCDMLQTYKNEMQNTINELSDLVQNHTPEVKDMGTNTESEPDNKADNKADSKANDKANDKAKAKPKAASSKANSKASSKANSKANDEADVTQDDEFQDKIIVIDEPDTKPKRRGRKPRKTTTS